MQLVCDDDTDAHAVLRVASSSLTRVQRSTGLRWSKRTIDSIQKELGWRWKRMAAALQDLDDFTTGAVVDPDSKGVLLIPTGYECRCETRLPSSSGRVLDTELERGSSRVRAGATARGGPRPPSPSSPSSLPAAADSGSSVVSGRAGMGRSGDSNEEEIEDEAPHTVAGRRIGRRDRSANIADLTGDKKRRQRQRTLKRRRTPVEEWNGLQLAEEFVEIAQRKLDEFGQHRNPHKPLAKFFSEARLAGIPNRVLVEVMEEYLENYRLEGPPWRPFISAAPGMITQHMERETAFGRAEERVDDAEIGRRYGSARRLSEIQSEHSSEQDRG